MTRAARGRRGGRALASGSSTTRRAYQKAIEYGSRVTSIIIPRGWRRGWTRPGGARWVGRTVHSRGMVTPRPACRSPLTRLFVWTLPRRPKNAQTRQTKSAKFSTLARIYPHPSERPSLFHLRPHNPLQICYLKLKALPTSVRA